MYFPEIMEVRTSVQAKKLKNILGTDCTLN